MPRRLPVLVACVLAAGAIEASAQLRSRTPPIVAVHASATAGNVSGFVMDDSGKSVGGVSVLAMGTVLAVAQSDAGGRFSLALPAGEYVLRAAREGYISTYREPVRVQGNVTLERVIRLVRVGTALEQTAAEAGGVAADPADERSHSHGELAWKLRHLGRTVLRSETHGLGVIGGVADEATEFVPATAWDLALQGSARTAASFLRASDFTGEVNILTTSSRAVRGTWPAEWPRGLTYLAIGAPVAGRADWSVRAALSGGDRSSWTFAGDYKAHADEPHAVEIGGSFSRQSFVLDADDRRMVADERSAASFFVADVWRVSDRLTVDYGVQFERYDYLADALASPRAGFRFQITPRFSARIAGADRLVAPGSEQFLPPSSAGPWLPPQRTFSSLRHGVELAPERVRGYAIGVSRTLDTEGKRALTVERFEQSTSGQLATVFGIDSASAVGHYYVLPVGNADVTGWRVEVAGSLARYVHGTVGLSIAEGRWTTVPGAGALWRFAPSAIRRGRELLQDFTTALNVSVPETATQLTLGYRLSSKFASDRRRLAHPGAGGRFSIELRQALPYQPLSGGRLNALFALRTLHRDLHDDGSFYDELLTIKPPLRVTGGLQVGF